jgi:DNA-directed RNA polymerase subunit E'/Rpb7
MQSPYINTALSSIVTLDAAQMNNNIYNNLKFNLIRQLEGKCFRQYGFITKVYAITERGHGSILAENPLSSATFKVKFTCRLCNPLKGLQMICKIDKTTPILIGMIAGPMRIIALPEHINKNVFYTDKNNNLKYKNKNTSHTIDRGTHVKITILSKTFNDMDNVILVFANLDDIATKEEIEKFYQDEYSNDDENTISFEEYMKKEKTIEQPSNTQEPDNLE